MNELKNELQALQSLDQNTLEDVQRARLAELPGLIVAEAEKTAEELEKTKKDKDSALAQKDHYRTKFEKEEADKKALEEKLKGTGRDGLAVEDFIDISATLEGLDSREKEFLAKQHKLTGQPLGDIKKDKDFLLWQSAHRSEMEKERALKPSNTPGEGDQPKSLAAKLAGASMADKEKILVEAGLYKTPRPRSDRTRIGEK